MRKKTKKLIIKAEDIKVSTGHRQHFTGTGAWDNRPKRQRTRSAQTRATMKEYLIMVTAISKAGTPVEFTLTGIAGTSSRRLKMTHVLIENEQRGNPQPKPCRCYGDAQIGSA